jgi:FRG domain
MNNPDFKLNSGLYRKEGLDESQYIDTERRRYQTFLRLGYMHIKDEEWNLLFTMQHYGVGTRLLDWSESFSVALFFAFKNKPKDKDAVVWILDPLKLNQISVNRSLYYTPKNTYANYIKQLKDPVKKMAFYNSRAMYPMRNSDRIVAQQGMFTLQGIAGMPLEEEHEGRLIQDGVLKKLIISKNLHSDVESFLKQSGISPFTMFPDLGGLAEHINNAGYSDRKSINIVIEKNNESEQY